MGARTVKTKAKPHSRPQPTQEAVDSFARRATHLMENLADILRPLHLSAIVRRPEALARIRGQALAFARSIEDLEQQLLKGPGDLF